MVGLWMLEWVDVLSCLEIATENRKGYVVGRFLVAPGILCYTATVARMSKYFQSARTSNTFFQLIYKKNV